MIEFLKFEKWYGSRQAVKPLDLKIGRGETFALLGPNGGGKTTALRALVGLHLPTKGRVVVNSVDVAKDPVRVKRMLSYLPQRVTTPNLLTAREVVALFAGLQGVPRRRVNEVLDLMALGGDADRMVYQFSGGMLQRLGLAIAFLRDVDVLVLDEPTLNLDALGIERFRDLARAMKERGSTVVFSSHIMDDAQKLADRVGILVEGKLAEIIPVAEFRERLSQETTVRVVLNTTENGVASAAQRAGAAETRSDGRNFMFKAPPGRRLVVIRAIEHAGTVVEEIHTEPPNWEAMIGKHFTSNGDRE